MKFVESSSFFLFCIDVFLLKDTVTGFLLGGIGELNAKNRKPNFLIVDKSLFEKIYFSFILKFIHRYKIIGY
jgi:hypothetical protein